MTTTSCINHLCPHLIKSTIYYNVKMEFWLLVYEYDYGTRVGKRLVKIIGNKGIKRLKNGGDSLMLQRLLGHTTLMMTNRYCQAVGCYDAIEAHKEVFTGGWVGLVSYAITSDD